MTVPSKQQLASRIRTELLTALLERINNNNLLTSMMEDNSTTCLGADWHTLSKRRQIEIKTTRGNYLIKIEIEPI